MTIAAIESLSRYVSPINPGKERSLLRHSKLLDVKVKGIKGQCFEILGVPVNIYMFGQSGNKKKPRLFVNNIFF